MKYVKQLLLILFISFIGEIFNKLLFFGLLIGIIKLENVKEGGSFLIEIMPIMFIPAGVGLMTSWVTLKKILIPVLIITALTNVTVMLATGHISQMIIRKSGNDNNE